MTMRFDGDPYWRHDGEDCSLDHPCARCELEELERLEEERDSWPEAILAAIPAAVAVLLWAIAVYLV